MCIVRPLLKGYIRHFYVDIPNWETLIIIPLGFCSSPVKIKKNVRVEGWTKKNVKSWSKRHESPFFWRSNYLKKKKKERFGLLFWFWKTVLIRVRSTVQRKCVPTKRELSSLPSSIILYGTPLPLVLVPTHHLIAYIDMVYTLCGSSHFLKTSPIRYFISRGARNAAYHARNATLFHR